MMEVYGSLPLTNGSGSGSRRPIYMDPTDPDPQHRQAVPLHKMVYLVLLSAFTWIREGIHLLVLHLSTYETQKNSYLDPDYLNPNPNPDPGFLFPKVKIEKKVYFRIRTHGSN